MKKKSRANGLSRNWDVAQMKYRANKMSRNWDVAQMGCRARKSRANGISPTQPFSPWLNSRTQVGLSPTSTHNSHFHQLSVKPKIDLFSPPVGTEPTPPPPILKPKSGIPIDWMDCPRSPFTVTFLPMKTESPQWTFISGKASGYRMYKRLGRGQPQELLSSPFRAVLAAPMRDVAPQNLIIKKFPSTGR